MLLNETIAAIATAPGEASISVVRVSGPKAIEISEIVFSGPVSQYHSHSVHLGSALAPSGKIIDKCLVLVMRAPKSFTGEDTVEFQCHGGYFASTKILEALFHAGARAALPGEFTQRAFLNGKIDLIQAEAIQNIIAAENSEAFDIAQNHLKGAFSKKISQISQLIIQALAFLEVQADFPEEGEDFSMSDQSLAWISEALLSVQELLGSFNEGQQLSQGATIVLAGNPNAGKSSLLNAFLEEDRAIVTDIPGTTRDMLRESWTIGGKTVKLVDTAGTRNAEDPVEKAGIQKSFQAMETAKLILWVADPADETADLPAILEEKPSFLIWNKADLNHPIPRIRITIPQFSVSAKTRQGLRECKQAISEWLHTNSQQTSSRVFLVSSRHYNILKKVAEKLQTALRAYQSGIEPEFIALELREALQETGVLSGKEATEEVLGEIFSQFCIGK
ncbi:tRNA uridine-5-carboxymethylaminomethyl(34) synthesis GTPase MnmE [Chlamydiifrater phoenicopteri]|uniref:tRNA uridine-5-carboxymethylaminomethyl(34) synthesis GTPase MnmE n=1 Tax=Chlamydiifrater phoenicopteri TaxID=2681469 RepID=UPI001BCB0AF5|nr:tRNA uridine-5-carboxymethylaminomethyl(34) synthesis GTPase MnmE [Chlamydiifrater phoenicopteri]